MKRSAGDGSGVRVERTVEQARVKLCCDARLVHPEPYHHHLRHRQSSRQHPTTSHCERGDRWELVAPLAACRRTCRPSPGHRTRNSDQDRPVSEMPGVGSENWGCEGERLTDFCLSSAKRAGSNAPMRTNHGSPAVSSTRAAACCQRPMRSATTTAASAPDNTHLKREDVVSGEFWRRDVGLGELRTWPRCEPDDAFAPEHSRQPAIPKPTSQVGSCNACCMFWGVRTMHHALAVLVQHS